jgi:hypothetical protein
MTRKQSRLPKRDWILLPACGLLALVLTLGPLEVLSRTLFHGGPSDSLSCMVLHDPQNGPHAIPNSECSFKVPESNCVTYQFNSRGHRAGMELGVKRPGVYRIVLIGTSMAEGLHVPWNQTFAALLPKELSRQTGRKVEVYNEALEWESPCLILQHLKGVIDADPDAILWAVTKWDVENASLVTPSALAPVKATVPGGRWARAWQRAFDSKQSRSAADRIADTVKHTFQVISPGTVFLFEHFLYQNDYEYVKSFLATGNDTEFLQAKPDKTWQGHLREFDRYVSDVEARAAEAGIPVIATVLPSRIEATLISLGQWPSGLDPFKFGEEVRSTFEKHGGTYLDLLSSFRGLRHAERYYYAVDGHPNAAGQAIFFNSLAKGLRPTVAAAPPDSIVTASLPPPPPPVNQQSPYQMVKNERKVLESRHKRGRRIQHRRYIGASNKLKRADV